MLWLWIVLGVVGWGVLGWVTSLLFVVLDPKKKWTLDNDDPATVGAIILLTPILLPIALAACPCWFIGKSFLWTQARIEAAILTAREGQK